MTTGPRKEFKTNDIKKERESYRNEKEKTERKTTGGGGGRGGAFDRRLKCNCAISFLFQHNEE